MRRCLDCKLEKPATDFYAKRKNEDGTVRVWQSYCKPCQRERDRARRARLPKRPRRKAISHEEELARRRERYQILKQNPRWLERKREVAREVARRRREDPARRPKVLAAQARWKQRVYSDPERVTMARIEARMNARIAGRVTTDRRRTIAVEAYEPPTPNASRVPAAPFVALLAEMFPDVAPLEIAALLGWDQSHAQRVIGGEYRRICLHVVDRLLTEGLGRPDLLDVLYPLEEGVAA